jgi:hypothetical protein
MPEGAACLSIEIKVRESKRHQDPRSVAMKPFRWLLIAAMVLCSFSASNPALRADETDDYINQIYQDQKETDDYLNGLARDQEQLNDNLNSIYDQTHEDRDEWLERIGLGNGQIAGAAGGQQAAPMNAQQAAAALKFMQQALALQQKQLQAMGLQGGLLPGRAPNVPAPKPPAPAVANAARPKPAAPPPPAMSRDELASGKFNMAMMLANAGKADAAEDYCKFIVKTYPGTAGAKSAQAFLEKPIQ